jgi:hypothetical protein
MMIFYYGSYHPLREVFQLPRDHLLLKLKFKEDHHDLLLIFGQELEQISMEQINPLVHFMDQIVELEMNAY